MRSRPAGIIIFVLLVIATVPLMRLVVGERAAPEAQPVADLHIEGRGVVRITAYWVFGQSLGLYYKVLPERVLEPEAEPVEETAAARDEAGAEEAEAEVDRGAFFGTMSQPIPSPKFVVHQADGGEVIAIAFEWAPEQVLILHDFATGDSWPNRQEEDTVESMAADGRALLSRLQSELPEAASFELVPSEFMRPLPRPGVVEP